MAWLQARAIAKRKGLTHVEFRLGEIECLPVEANTVDVIISNCVINLSPAKDRVFAEAFRVLKPGACRACSRVLSTAWGCHLLRWCGLVFDVARALPDDPVGPVDHVVERSGGRLAVSDVVKTAAMPPDVLHDLAALCGCISGAVTVDELTTLLTNAGFTGIDIKPMVRRAHTVERPQH